MELISCDFKVQTMVISFRLIGFFLSFPSHPSSLPVSLSLTHSHPCLLLCGLVFFQVLRDTLSEVPVYRGGWKQNGSLGAWSTSMVAIKKANDFFLLGEIISRRSLLKSHGKHFPELKSSSSYVETHSKSILVCLRRTMWSDSKQGSCYSLACCFRFN